MRYADLLIACLMASILASCTGPKEVEAPPDERFGHRFVEQGPDGRRTMDVSPPRSGGEFYYYPAVIDTVQVRPAPFTSDMARDGQVPVEILVKGSLPDACTELHDVDQERMGHLIEIRLEMRRPRGVVCASVVRPYRFYLALDGLYGPGSYTMKLNRKVFPFGIRPPDAG